jgi:hypothetical protein
MKTPSNTLICNWLVTLNDGDRVVSYAIGGTSIAALLVAIIELPNNLSILNLILGGSIGIGILVTLTAYYFWRRKFRNSRTEEETRLRHQFPRIYAFLESIESIKGEGDFQKFEAQLNLLIETEKRSRSIKWKEMQDIEAIKGIALAKLVQKKKFKA